MARQNMLRAVNKELRTFPEDVQACATAELARQLAREFDAGDRPAANPLMGALRELRKLAAPPKTKGAAADVPAEEDAPDELDEIGAKRAARLADASGVVRTLGADDRRPGGRRAR